MKYTGTQNFVLNWQGNGSFERNESSFTPTQMNSYLCHHPVGQYNRKVTIFTNKSII